MILDVLLAYSACASRNLQLRQATDVLNKPGNHPYVRHIGFKLLDYPPFDRCVECGLKAQPSGGTHRFHFLRRQAFRCEQAHYQEYRL